MRSFKDISSINLGYNPNFAALSQHFSSRSVIDLTLFSNAPFIAFLIPSLSPALSPAYSSIILSITSITILPVEIPTSIEPVGVSNLLFCNSKLNHFNFLSIFLYSGNSGNSTFNFSNFF